MKIIKLAFAAVPMLALTLAAAAPAEAQSRYYGGQNPYDQRRDNGGDVVAGVVIGAIAGGLLASAASNNDNDCGYYRDGRCWRNQGHWEREHGINSRYGYNDRRDYRYDRRDDRRDRRYDRRDDRRDYRYDRRW